MSTDRLHPESLLRDLKPAVEEESAPDTPIYLPLEFNLDPPLTSGAGDSWLEVIRYWVDELRWWKKYWGSHSD